MLRDNFLGEVNKYLLSNLSVTGTESGAVGMKNGEEGVREIIKEITWGKLVRA